VMNGLESELRSRLLSLTAHVTITADEGLDEWQALAERLAGREGVASVSPYVALEAMLASGANLVPTVVRGILPAQGDLIAQNVTMLDEGRIDRLEPGSNGLILGRTLAAMLGVYRDDRIAGIVPQVDNERLTPRFAGFTVAGIFDAGVPDHNQGLALTHLADASGLAGLDGRPEGLEVRLDDALAVGRFRRAIADVLEDP